MENYCHLYDSDRVVCLDWAVVRVGRGRNCVEWCEVCFLLSSRADLESSEMSLKKEYLWEGTNVPKKSESKSASHGLIINGWSPVSPIDPLVIPLI